MLEVKNLTTVITTPQTDFLAVDQVSFRIEPGEVVALIGESGCGKSMTALSIMRLIPTNAAFANDSKILFHGKNLLDLPEKDMRKIRGGDIGMIFQDPMTSLNPVITIGEQIAEVLKIHQNLSGRQGYIESLRLLEAVRIPDAVQRYNSYPHELSGGMKQRVMIAMALASKPSLLIADEPTTALDVTTQAQILSLIRSLQRQFNMAILLITHNLTIAAQMADTVLVMRSGRILEISSSNRFFLAPKHPYSKQLLDSIPQYIKSSNSLQLKNHEFKQPIMAAKDVAVFFPIKLGWLRKTVGYVKAVDGVDFVLEQGKTLAIVGESGSGKTTLGKALLGLQKTQNGSVEYAGQNILGLSNKDWRPIRRKLQMIFQDPYAALDPKARINESLEEGLLLLRPELNAAQRQEKIDALLEQVGLKPEFKWRFPHEFSGGERQRLCIARALTMQPETIVCDEPTSSLDVSIQAQILQLLQRLQQENKLSYIFISHDLAVVRVLADQIAVMYLGKIVEVGLADEIFNDAKHPYTQDLLSVIPTLNPNQKIFDNVAAGEIPSPSNPPSGCHFHPRCKFAKAQCRKEYPDNIQISPTHSVKCILYQQKLAD